MSINIFAFKSSGTKIPVDVSGVTRLVSLRNKPDTNILYGLIGDGGKFYWDTTYSLPLVHVKQYTKMPKQQVRRVAKAFICGYINKLVESRLTDNKSPMHFESIERTEEYLRRATASAESEGRISGVPRWMRENCKVWTPCYSRTTGELLYYRRTKYTSDDVTRALVARYLPLCAGCILRVDCDKPCNAPESVSVKTFIS